MFRKEFLQRRAHHILTLQFSPFSFRSFRKKGNFTLVISRGT